MKNGKKVAINKKIEKRQKFRNELDKFRKDFTDKVCSHLMNSDDAPSTEEEATDELLRCIGQTTIDMVFFILNNVCAEFQETNNNAIKSVLTMRLASQHTANLQLSVLDDIERNVYCSENFDHPEVTTH